ncbi:PTS sugar transporter subunit IIA [uncultured Enorma sp.]|uniref:BglG family transcription antiterminator n=1 Tax=uncultured Enorma sp. TaxID=1714346 RepID=UPI002804A636|nr:PTS sugar transporter subunit IIA [uncultured Enorma sp.]
MLNNRQTRILAALTDAKGPITGGELAVMLGVSLRTVQGDIAGINRAHALVRSSNRGYTVDREALEELDDERDLTPDSSIAHSALQILVFEGRQRIDDLSEELYVSTPTLERHLRALAPMLSACGLALERKGGWVSLEGSEGGKRQLIGNLVARETAGTPTSANATATIFESMDREVVLSIVESTVASFGYRIRPGFESNLMGSITIALYRMRTSSFMPEAAESIDDGRIEYRIAKELCRRYSVHFNIAPSRSDLVYLAHLFRGQIEQVEQDNADANPPIGMTKFVQEVEGIVNEVLEFFSLHVSSTQSLYNFAMHVDALLYRTADTQIQSVEVLENVKRHMPFVYEIALLVAKRVEEHFDIKISDGEVGFICIHMGMILRSTMDEERVGIGLACQDYQGISERISENILDRYSEAATIYKLNMPVQPEDVARLPIDMVVSTQRLQGLPVRTVEVSPFLSTSDLMNIEDAVSACFKRKQGERMRRLVRDHLDEQLFFKTDAFATKHDAITFLGSKLLEYGVVNESFTDSVLQREAISSTCFFELFAIPHGLEMDSKRTMMAILLSDRGVIWDDVPIHIVLMIAVNREDRKEFVELYNAMVKSLCDSHQVARVMRATSLDEFVAELDRE